MCGRIDAVTISDQISRLAAILGPARLIFRDEAELQAQIAQLLEAAGVLFQRERVLSAGDRVDFLVLPGLGVEVKVGGPRTAIIRQLSRYAMHGAIQGLVLVTASLRHATAFPREIGGKPVACVYLMGSTF